MNDVVYISLTEMSERIRAKKLSPVELVDAHLARITQLNPKVNAFVTVDEKRAREQAKSAEAALSSSAKSNSIGPLHGVPISIKSSIDVEGLPSECGSALRKGNVPSEDAPLVKRLRAAGAIILGNTKPTTCSMGERITPGIFRARRAAQVAAKQRPSRPGVPLEEWAVTEGDPFASRRITAEFAG